MTAIEQLLAFVKDGTQSDLSTWLEKHCSQADTTPRLLGIALLDWLRGRANLKRQYPLRLKSFPWCEALKSAVRDGGSLGDILVVKGDTIDFKQTVAQETIAQIEAAVLASYNPVMFVD